MAAGTAASAASGGNSGGVGGNPINPVMGFMNGAMGRATQQLLDRNAAASATAASTAAGARMQSRGGGIGKRMGSIESRLDALEGGGKSEDSFQSVKPVQEFGTGGSFGNVSSAPPAPVAAGTLNATSPPGSPQEAMPSPGNPAADMFGTEFMRNASVGAAKMRKNKKLEYGFKK